MTADTKVPAIERTASAVVERIEGLAIQVRVADAPDGVTTIRIEETAAKLVDDHKPNGLSFEPDEWNELDAAVRACLAAVTGAPARKRTGKT